MKSIKIPLKERLKCLIQVVVIHIIKDPRRVITKTNERTKEQ